ncbi:MAG TPA: hypothetical protein VKV22_13515 [Rhodanobacteraceae bacterium]|nr:hypothetical protein [Rhodanobacteraceae bacterium]
MAYRQFQQSENPYSPIFLKNRTGNVTVEPLQPIKTRTGNAAKSSAQPPSSSDPSQNL